VISLSDELRAQLTRSLPKVITIHNGIDEDKVVSPFTAPEAKQRLVSQRTALSSARRAGSTLSSAWIFS
jgi:hypothetical protein